MAASSDIFTSHMQHFHISPLSQKLKPQSDLKMLPTCVAQQTHEVDDQFECSNL
jgi:hypothetical protein